MPDRHWGRRISSREQSRRAFSLVELLVALALSVVLISAIYSAISLHWRYETLGRERINRSQVSLALFRKLNEDVGSVMFTVPQAAVEEEESTTSGSTATSSSTTSSSTSTSTPTLSTATPVAGTGTTSTDATSSAATGTSSLTGGTSSASAGAPAVVTPTSLGIVGTVDYLQLDVNLPLTQDFITSGDQTSSVTATSTTDTTTSELLRVTWMVITPKQSETPQTGIESLIHNPALARHQTDRLSESLLESATTSNNPNASSAIASDTSTTTTDSITATQTTLPEIPDSSILAREIVSLQFRYYDGYSWVTEWDSTQMGRLPRAIEVSMGYISQDPRYAKGSLQMGTVPVTTIKQVIQVPASTPVSGSEI